MDTNGTLTPKQQRLIAAMLAEPTTAADVKAVIAGDHHKSSKVSDTQRSGLMHYVVGAVGGTLSEYSQKSLQSQRFSILSLFEDGSYDISDAELEITP